MKKTTAILSLIAIVATASLIGYARSNTNSKTPSNGVEEKTTIKVGVRADGIEMIELLRKNFESKGYKLVVIPFEDSIQPNVALKEKSVDANWFQHIPYLTSYNEKNGTDFVMVEPYTHYPLFSMYSDKYGSIAEIPDGVKIGVCNDASNQARGLNMLQAHGLIKLDDSVKIPTIYDIKENPHNFEFVEAEMTTLANSMTDYGAICLAAAHMATAGLDGTNYICQSMDGKDYALGFVVNPENKDAQWLQDLIKSSQIDEIANYFKTAKQGTLVPLWR